MAKYKKSYPGEKKKSGTAKWWTKEAKGQRHRLIFDAVTTLHNNSRDRQERNLRCLRLYGNMESLALGTLNYLDYATPTLPTDRLRINIACSMTDTVASKISKMKPRVSFLTSGGDFSSQRQAKDLSKFMVGAFYMNKIHDLHKQGFRDCEIFDVGALKHFICDDQIVTERKLALQLYMDPMDALYGQPRTLYEVQYMPRSVACELWPEYESAIKASKETIDRANTTDAFVEEFICVIEAWRLPSKKGGSDGKHCLVISNETIVDEEYKYTYFPFTWFRWSRPVIGFWGQSLVDRLTSTQMEINKMLRIIQRSFHLGSAFKVFLEYGSKVSKEHVNNDIGSIIYYLGKPPEYYVPKVVSSEYFEHLRFLLQSAYEEAGISQLSASARKPAGLDSGKALREYNDIETERFALVAQDYENSFLDTARIYLDLAREIGEDYKVQAQSKNFVETIRWGDVAPQDEDGFIMQMFPVSMLPHEPVGRLAFIQELINSGMITPEFGTELLDFPDLESYLSIKNAALEDLMATLEDLLEGDYNPPEPFQDLQNGIPLFQSAYLRYKRLGADESKLDNVRRWIATADAMLQKAQAASRVQPQSTLPFSPQGQSEGSSQPQGQPQQTAPQAPASMQPAAMPVAAPVAQPMPGGPGGQA